MIMAPTIHMSELPETSNQSDLAHPSTLLNNLTSAFALSKPLDNITIDNYVWEHVHFFLEQVQRGISWLDIVLNEASKHIQVCLRPSEKQD
jgi:hypothetical protein